MASPDTLIASPAVARGRPPCAYHNSGVQSLVTVLEILHCRSVGMYDTARLTVARANSLTTHGFAGIHYCCVSRGPPFDPSTLNTQYSAGQIAAIEVLPKLERLNPYLVNRCPLSYRETTKMTPI